jgi:hypothetical protein
MVFSPDSSETFLKKNLIFVAVKERLQEATFARFKNWIFKKGCSE